MTVPRDSGPDTGDLPLGVALDRLAAQAPGAPAITCGGRDAEPGRACLGEQPVRADAGTAGHEGR
jgi:hypothetical protein